MRNQIKKHEEFLNEKVESLEMSFSNIQNDFNVNLLIRLNIEMY